MHTTLNLLLTEIERESSQVRQSFGRTKVHHGLEDFSRAVGAFERLDDMLKPNRDFSDVEAKIIGTYYSALAFRIVDTSLKYDEPKFRKAKEIIERAEEITMDAEPAVHQAKNHLYRKLSQFEPNKIERILSRIDQHLALFGRVVSNEYANLVFDVNYPEFRFALNSERPESLASVV